MDAKVVSQEEWTGAQKQFKARQQELNEARARLNAERLKLPWVKVEKTYQFDGPAGKESLADLFQGRSQLVMQHFMFSPEWTGGCPGCSVMADSVDGARYHFEPKDVSFVAVSRAPLPKILAYKARMGWKFKWVSSFGQDFNYDFQVSFTKEELAKGQAIYNFEKQKVDREDLPGMSSFYKDNNGEIFRTSSNYSDLEPVLPVYGYLDLSPKGRDEKEYFDWIKRHDEYN